MKKPDKNGKCFENNGRWFIDIGLKYGRESKYADQYKLVHGLVTNAIDGKPMMHCWIEEKTDHNHRVYDDSRGDRPVFTKDFYYAMARINPENIVEMSYKEAFTFMSKTGHYGPWKNSEHLFKIAGR